MALLLITISCSLLGVFVLWKKLAYFGDGLSHSILLGFILGTLFDLNQTLALVLLSLFFASLVSFITKNDYFSKDTVIAISAYFCISLALILSHNSMEHIDFESYITGDITSVTRKETYSLAIISLFSIFYTKFAFRKILLINVNQDFAKIEGINVKLWDLSFLILLSLVISFSVRITGVFLMTALLILPAAIARIFSISAKKMMFLSLIIGVTTSVFSFEISNNHNLAISPILIATFCLMLIFSLIFKKIFSQ
ncbi:MAG: metal ABC transporter permease [Rickettsiales bacterium]|nr:metal ABC transporter permease [Rickettsiales bacterium]